MADSLRTKSVRALSWSFLETVALQGVRFGLLVLLARLLFPEDFGLIGMLTIFMAVTHIFLDSGFGAALIQKRDATETDACTVFYFNILAGLAVTGLLCVVAPWIAGFFNRPILTPLTRALSLTMLITSFGLIQSVMLEKKVDFRTLTKVSLLASLLSGIIGITLAAMGFGVWSLVVQQISSSFFRTFCLWFFNGWRPALIFSFRSLREMFRFSSRLLYAGLLNQLFENVYLLIIGKLFSAADLGYFTRAKSVGELPPHTLSEMVGRVTFPVFSTIQGDPVRLKAGMKKALTTLAFANFAIMVGLAVTARPLVLAFFTEKWAESIVYLQLLSLVGLLYPLHYMTLMLLQALGRADIILHLEIIKKALIVINIVITVWWGISAMIYGMIFMSIFSYYLGSYYTGVLIGYGVRAQLRDLIPYLIMALLMGIAVYSAGLLPFSNVWTMLLVQIATGTVSYVCLCRLFRLAAFTEIWQVAQVKIKSLKARTA